MSECEEHRTNRRDHDEFRPHDFEVSAMEQHALCEADKVGGRRQRHQPAHDVRHAFTRRQCAGPDLQRQQDQDAHQPKLRHVTRQRAHEDADRGRGEQVEPRRHAEQHGRAGYNHAEYALHHHLQ